MTRGRDDPKIMAEINRMSSIKGRGSSPGNDAALERRYPSKKAPAAAPATSRGRDDPKIMAEINRMSSIKGRGSSPGNDAALERLYPTKKKK